MSVYEPLQNHLKSLKYGRWKATFSEIEQVLNRRLPKSAYSYQAWWANQEGHGHSQTAAWRDIGWRTTNLDLAGKRVEFERIAPRAEDRSGTRLPPDLVRKAAMYLGTTDETVLYREGLQALIEREAARRLSRLGGTNPSFEAPPRRRAEEA